jgi:hypothetical protein
MFYDYFKKQNEIDKRDIGHEYSLYRVYKENLDTYHHFELAKKRTKIVNYSLMPLFITIA